MDASNDDEQNESVNEKKSVFQDALERARQVAAKLNQQQQTGVKRTSDDSDVSSCGGKKPVLSPPPSAINTEGMTASQIAAMRAAEVARQINEQLGIASKQRTNEVATVATLLHTEYLRVPDSLVGLIIGKGGEKIARIQTESACKIQISQELLTNEKGDGMERQCTLTGSQEAIDRAKTIINEVLEGGLRRRNARLDGTNKQTSLYGEYGNKRADLVEITYNVPTERAGYVIGKGGETIKEINRRSGAFVETDRVQKPSEPGTFRVFRIRGTKEQAAVAQELIEEKCKPPVRSSIQFRSGGAGANAGMGSSGSSAYAANNTNVPTWQQVPSEALYQAAGIGAAGTIDWATRWQNYVMASAGLAAAAAAADVQHGTASNTITPFEAAAHQYATAAAIAAAYAHPTSGVSGNTSVTSPSFGTGAGGGMIATESTSPMAMVNSSADVATTSSLTYPTTTGATSDAMNPTQNTNTAAPPAQDYSLQWAQYYRSLGMHEQADAILEQAAKTFSSRTGNTAADQSQSTYPTSSTSSNTMSGTSTNVTQS